MLNLSNTAFVLIPHTNKKQETSCFNPEETSNEKCSVVGTRPPLKFCQGHIARQPHASPVAVLFRKYNIVTKTVSTFPVATFF